MKKIFSAILALVLISCNLAFADTKQPQEESYLYTPKLEYGISAENGKVKYSDVKVIGTIQDVSLLTTSFATYGEMSIPVELKNKEGYKLKSIEAVRKYEEMGSLIHDELIDIHSIEWYTPNFMIVDQTEAKGQAGKLVDVKVMIQIPEPNAFQSYYYINAKGEHKLRSYLPLKITYEKIKTE